MADAESPIGIAIYRLQSLIAVTNFQERVILSYFQDQHSAKQASSLQHQQQQQQLQQADNVSSGGVATTVARKHRQRKQCSG